MGIEKLATSKTTWAFFVFLLSVTWHVRIVSSIRCYSQTGCDAGMLPGNFGNSRECCVDSEKGVAFDSSGESERCSACEVIGWEAADVYTTESSEVELVFGTRRGSAAARYRFQLKYVSNGANTSVDASALEAYDFLAMDFKVTVHVPPSSDDERYTERNSTFDMTLLAPQQLSNEKFIHPMLATVYIIVPEVQFEGTSYILRYPDNSLSLCLSYTDTEGYAEFTANISISKPDGAISEERAYDFTRESGRVCQTVTLPLPELDPFHNTSFTARVLTSNDPDTPSVYDVGSPDTATITVQAIDPPILQFQHTNYTLFFPESSIELCIAHTAVYVPFEAEVTLSKQEDRGSDLLSTETFMFTDRDSVSCLTLSLSHSSYQMEPFYQFSDTLFEVVILDKPEAVYRLGASHTATITLVGLQVSQVAFQAESYEFSELMTSVEVCLVRTNIPEEEEETITVTVSVSRKEDDTSPRQQTDYMYTFSAKDSLACQNITDITRSGQLFLEIVTPSQPLFQVGSPSTALIVGDDVEPTVVTEGEKEGEGEGESGGGMDVSIEVGSVSMSRNSGISPLVIALSTVIPGLLIVAIVIIVVILVYVAYRHKHYTSHSTREKM